MASDAFSNQASCGHAKVGPCNKQMAEKLFYKLPEPLKKAQYYTDYFFVYYETIGCDQYYPVGKESNKKSYIERLNTLRQRCSRLVRKMFSFLKKLLNNIGMMMYFICNYNLLMQAPHI